MSDNSLTIHIDDKVCEAKPGQMIIEVADQNGVTIPRFCYHRKLSVAANCRMCLIEVENARKPMPACATPVSDGMKVKTNSETASNAQRSVMEFLLINHPLDCPICDQGGECELQDLALGYGGDVSRFNERKRVVEDKNIGPLIATDLTRCIHCTRCVRFGEEIAGLAELGATGRGENMKIGTYISKSVASELSANVIDVCPVGALTNKPFRFKARAWEIKQRPSISPHDALGSNLNLHIAHNKVVRVVPRANDEVNECWLADRDRFSCYGLESMSRLQQPMVKVDGKWTEVDLNEALKVCADILRQTIKVESANAIGALVSPNSTVEESYLLQKILRGLGCNNIDHRLRQSDFSDQDAFPPAPGLGAELKNLESMQSILVVGANLRKDLPLLNTRLRKAVLNGAKVFTLNMKAYESNYSVAHQEIVHPAKFVQALKDFNNADHPIFKEMQGSENAIVLLGQSALNMNDAAHIRAHAQRFANATGARLGLITEGANSAGAWISGAIPHRGPGNVELEVSGKNVKQMMQQPVSTYVLFGVEPEFDCNHSATALKAMQEAQNVIAFTPFVYEEMKAYANVLLPLSVFAENEGTYVNLSGTWQSFSMALHAKGAARPGWKMLRVLGNLLNIDGIQFNSYSEVLDECLNLCANSDLSKSGRWSEMKDEQDSTEQINDEKADMLYRIGEVPIYAGDNLVRRAMSLQQTNDGDVNPLQVNSNTAAKLNIANGQTLEVVQSDSQAVSLEVSINDVLPDNVLDVPTAMDFSNGLGDLFGPIRLATLNDLK